MHDALARAFGLDGRVAVVTGAASGIGRETACVLAQAGARIVAADVDDTGLATTVTAIAAAGGVAQAQRTDMAERAQIDELAAAAAAAMGGIDIWVNAAGILVDVPIVEASEAQVARMIAVNQIGVYWGCATAGRAMRARGSGAIVNISSGGGESAVPGLSIYSMTKAAVNMVTRTAAKEFGAFGVRVNAVAPGFVETPMVNYRFTDEAGGIDAARRAEVLRQRAQYSPLGLTGTPRDIALAVLYLASDASRFMTGQILRPNGGVAMP